MKRRALVIIEQRVGASRPSAAEEGDLFFRM